MLHYNKISLIVHLKLKSISICRQVKAPWGEPIVFVYIYMWLTYLPMPGLRYSFRNICDICIVPCMGVDTHFLYVLNLCVYFKQNKLCSHYVIGEQSNTARIVKCNPLDWTVDNKSSSSQTPPQKWTFWLWLQFQNFQK